MYYPACRHLDVSQQDGITCIEFTSAVPVDPHQLADIKDELARIAVDEDRKAFVVDLSNQTYIDTGLLECLVKLWKKAREQQKQFIVCSLNQVCREVIETARFHKIWEIVSGREEAVRALRRQ